MLCEQQPDYMSMLVALGTRINGIEQLMQLPQARLSGTGANTPFSFGPTPHEVASFRDSVLPAVAAQLCA